MEGTTVSTKFLLVFAVPTVLVSIELGRQGEWSDALTFGAVPLGVFLCLLFTYYRVRRGLLKKLNNRVEPENTLKESVFLTGVLTTSGKSIDARVRPGRTWKGLLSIHGRPVRVVVKGQAIDWFWRGLLGYHSGGFRDPDSEKLVRISKGEEKGKVVRLSRSASSHIGTFDFDFGAAVEEFSVTLVPGILRGMFYSTLYVKSEMTATCWDGD